MVNKVHVIIIVALILIFCVGYLIFGTPCRYYGYYESFKNAPITQQNYQLVSNGTTTLVASPNTSSTLHNGQSLVQGKYKLLLQEGKLLIYDDISPIWNANIKQPGKQPYTLVMETDGNLVIRDYGKKEIWSSGTKFKGTGPWIAILQPDRNFCVKDSKGTVTWCSKTKKS